MNGNHQPTLSVANDARRQTHLEIPHLGYGHSDEHQQLPYTPVNRSAIHPLTCVPEGGLDFSLILLFSPYGRNSVVQVL